MSLAWNQSENSFWKYASSAMSLPGPFDFRDSNQDDPEGEPNRDLLQKFHSTGRHNLKGDPVKRERDRRLNLMRHFCENDSDVEVTTNCATSGKRLESNSNLKFLGEQLVSEHGLINGRVDRTQILITEVTRYLCYSSGSWEITTTPSCVGPADSEPELAFLDLLTRITMPRSQCLTQKLRKRSQNSCINVVGKVSHGMTKHHLLIILMSVSLLVDWTTSSSGEPHRFKWYVYSISLISCCVLTLQTGARIPSCESIRFEPGPSE